MSKASDLRKKLKPSRNTQFVDDLHRHLVVVHLRLTKADTPDRAMAITAFVLSVGDVWMLVTAGHWRTELDDTLAHGYSVKACRLFDAWGTQPQFKEPVPINYEDEKFVKVYDDSDYDYGVFFLSSPLNRAALQANGVRAFDELFWNLEDESSVDEFILIGVAAELSDVEAGLIRAISPVLRVERLDGPHRKDLETEAPTFWGRIQLQPPLTDIAGMSGGPIMAFKNHSDGTASYWLWAIQSGWWKQTRTIRGCLVKPFAEMISRIQEETT